MTNPIVLTGELVFDSLDDGGEALIVELDDSVAGEEGTDHGIWVRVISNLGDARMRELLAEDRFGTPEDHTELSPWIGRRVQVTIEEID